ncbi:MAG: hypothetical protein A3B47_02710 [Candidatus Levybacteria bacterium RIFCSPLOWO2_01_FULL_39_24]|nr:MAG: hypothetical protein A2800_02000 [Candidatus Levybacteria bacterium RIFCSPHIGHO2_01_FULL_40_16]OGH28828.1 MAG: hypothetical protein A3E12_04020 [Candidatus Levybacteria bacterium RIFCSPHIGHO2_12_FULL_39_9]OGH46532.1 MAG: hypothetical protein A3B47_02710 [Candidatus Levybacteria bacterium RIFCSPLOWO2_01_FULL_39_24]
MNANINLLLRTDKESLKKKKEIRILNLAAAVSLIGVGLISLSLFIWIQIINPGAIKREQENVLKGVSQFQNRQVKLFVLNNRIENIDKILKMRKDLIKTMNGLLAKIPSELSVDDFEVDDKSVIIAGQSKSLFAIGEFIDNLTNMVHNKEIIKSLTLSSLALDVSTNAYRISVMSEL